MLIGEGSPGFRAYVSGIGSGVVGDDRNAAAVALFHDAVADRALPALGDLAAVIGDLVPLADPLAALEVTLRLSVAVLLPASAAFMSTEFDTILM